MSTIHVDENGILTVTPSETSSYHDFDFLLNKRLETRNRMLKSRLTGCNEWIEFDSTMLEIPALMGRANFERYYGEIDGVVFEGAAFRLFDPATRLWSIHWAASSSVKLDPPTVGSFEDKVGRFYCNELHEGRPVILQLCWDGTDPNAPIWSQALSEDHGQTWEWNWFMYCKASPL